MSIAQIDVAGQSGDAIGGCVTTATNHQAEADRVTFGRDEACAMPPASPVGTVDAIIVEAGLTGEHSMTSYHFTVVLEPDREEPHR